MSTFGQTVLETAAVAGSASPMDSILASMGDVMSFASKILEFCVSNPILCFFLACSLVGAGIGVISRIKRFASSV